MTMSPERDGEPDEANHINYPSPTAETMDAGPFYSTGGRDENQEQHGQPHQTDHVFDHDQHHAHEPSKPEHDQHMDMSQEHTSPQQQGSRPANLEELRLAAQLGHGLAATPMMHAGDPNMNVEDPNLRAIMPHPEPDHQVHDAPPYIQEAETSDPMAQHSMPVPVGAPMPPHYPMNNDGVPPRKRSKVSRACDECRRKKIKCDAQSDSGDNPCSSCARSSIRCLFSRIPQKRGPSKGYIKELADRIHSIENKLESEGGLTQDDVERLFAPETHRQSSNTAPGEDPSRKRPFSSISTGDYTTPTPARQAPWGPEVRAIQPAGTEPDGLPVYSEASLAPQPSSLQPDGSSAKVQEAPMDVSMIDGEEQPAEIDEGVFQNFLAFAQPVYPILPNTKDRLETLLAHSPALVKTAFVYALQAVGQPASGNAKLASTLLSEWENADSTSSHPANIVHLQTLLLLIIDADSRASSSLPFLLARAVALANSMKLWKYTSVDVLELDSDEQLCLRIWWSLILMDRWHAAGTGQPTQIPDSSAVAAPGLVDVLGEACFHLTRLSKLLNRISSVISTLSPGTSTADARMAGMLSDYIENWREDLPRHIEPTTFPLAHLAYWHCRLLVYLLTPESTTSETWWPTKELANLLAANADIRAPLTNHFASLAAMSLSRLSKSVSEEARAEATREEATQLIKEILEKPGSVWDGVRERLADQASAAAEATAGHGLQHLADLAAAYEGGEDLTFTSSLAGGYLDLA